MNKTLREMTPEEEQAYIDKINEDFREFIVVAPFVEIGDASKGSYIKLRVQISEDRILIGNILFELQYLLYQRQKKYPEIKKLIVSELTLTPEISEDGFNPRRGLMIKMYFETEE